MMIIAAACQSSKFTWPDTVAVAACVIPVMVFLCILAWKWGPPR